MTQMFGTPMKAGIFLLLVALLLPVALGSVASIGIWMGHSSAKLPDIWRQVFVGECVVLVLSLIVGIAVVLLRLMDRFGFTEQSTAEKLDDSK